MIGSFAKLGTIVRCHRGTSARSEDLALTSPGRGSLAALVVETSKWEAMMVVTCRVSSKILGSNWVLRVLTADAQPPCSMLNAGLPLSLVVLVLLLAYNNPRVSRVRL